MSATNYQSYPLVVLATGQWHHIQLTYTAGASAQLDVFFDGVNVLSRVPVYTTGGQAAALLGLSYINGPSTPWQVHFDDLAVTIR